MVKLLPRDLLLQNINIKHALHSLTILQLFYFKFRTRKHENQVNLGQGNHLKGL